MSEVLLLGYNRGLFSVPALREARMRRGPMIDVEALCVDYGAFRAVREVSFEVQAGEIVSLLGPNGSGKSSTLAAIAGLRRPTSGSIRIAGNCHCQDREAVARILGYVPQELALYDELTIEQNLSIFGQLYGLSGSSLRRRIHAVLDIVELLPRRNAYLHTLSGGLQRRANLACALLHEPRVLLLDEPTVALDPHSRDILFANMDALRKNGVAILWTTHHLEEAEAWCDRALVLDAGETIACGPPGEIFRHSTCRAILLGTLRYALSEREQSVLRQRLGRDWTLEVLDRSICLEATSQEKLGRALAILNSLGHELESFRTPPASLDEIIERFRQDSDVLPMQTPEEIPGLHSQGAIGQGTMSQGAKWAA